MRSSKLFFALTLAGVLSANLVLGQNTPAPTNGGNGNDKNIPPRLQKQQDSYNQGNYLFPAQKRSNWAVGIMLGSAFTSGDVKSGAGYGIGINVQKALGHAFSLRGQFTTGVTTGQNYQFSRGYVNHGPNGGSRLPHQELESGVGINPWNLFYTTPRTTRFTSIPIN
ncbi:MAG: hypothetical protein ACKVTZ_21655, partial [Bacteroidia bacterium]